MCLFINSRRKAIYIIGQRKTFLGQRIQKISCVMKETDTHIFIISMNGGRKT